MPSTTFIEIIGARYSVTQSSSLAGAAEIMSLVTEHPLISTSSLVNSSYILGKIDLATFLSTKSVSIAPQIPNL